MLVTEVVLEKQEQVKSLSNKLEKFYRMILLSVSQYLSCFHQITTSSYNSTSHSHQLYRQKAKRNYFRVLRVHMSTACCLRTLQVLWSRESYGTFGHTPIFYQEIESHWWEFQNMLDSYAFPRFSLLWKNYIFQQEGASAQYSIRVTSHLSKRPSKIWIGCGRPVAWSAGSHNLTLYDFHAVLSSQRCFMHPWAPWKS